MTRSPRISGVVVHWGDPAPLAELVRAWPPDERLELLVVDNGGWRRDDGVWKAVERRARVVRPGGNLGFAGGANAGAAATAGDLLLILNPDARPEPGALEALLEGFAAHPEAAGLAPRLVGEDGAPQYAWQLRSLPSAAGLLLQELGWGRGPEARREPPAGAAVEQPAAAALALRRRVFEELGGFDAGFHPAWFEDVDLAARLAAAGETVLYWPRATFRHGLGGTVSQLGYGRFLWSYQRNLLRYLRIHHGTAAVAAGRLAVVAGLLVRAALLPLRIPRRAAGRGEALRGLAAALAGALCGWRLPKAWTLRPAGGASGPRVAPPAAPALPAVTVAIVTHDDAGDVEGCFRSVAALDHRPLEVVLADCASSDDTLGRVERHRALLDAAGIPLTVVPLEDNRGFAGGMNAALAASDAPWVLSLNADARPAADYLGRLLARAAAHRSLAVAAVTGRLHRPAVPGAPAILDACGMRLTRTWRHLDRGSGETDRGQYDHPARVFGATGAASLLRREALLDAAVDGAVFDPRFHSFREDAELAFRLRERGWEILYEPTARCQHRRRNLPQRRRAMPAVVNYHSLKNRYLLRIYHQTGGNLLRTLLPAFGRDLLALGYVLLREPTSLPAYRWLWRHRRELWARRRVIQARRRVDAAALDRWFGRSEMPL